MVARSLENLLHPLRREVEFLKRQLAQVSEERNRAVNNCDQLVSEKEELLNAIEQSIHEPKRFIKKLKIAKINAAGSGKNNNMAIKYNTVTKQEKYKDPGVLEPFIWLFKLNISTWWKTWHLKKRKGLNK